MLCVYSIRYCGKMMEYLGVGLMLTIQAENICSLTFDTN